MTRWRARTRGQRAAHNFELVGLYCIVFVLPSKIDRAMQPVDFKQSNATLVAPEGKEDDVNAVHAMRGTMRLASGRHRVVATRWTFSDEERERIADGEDVYLHVMGDGMPPVVLATELRASPE